MNGVKFYEPSHFAAWVRGHNGHPLNELADRLAVLARRNREMGLDELTNARMIASIREEARTSSADVPRCRQPNRLPFDHHG